MAAARRLSGQLLRAIHLQPARYAVASQSISIPRQTRIVTFGQERQVVGSLFTERSSSYGGSFSNRKLHSQNQAASDNVDTEEYEKAKMSSEGGANPVNYDEKATEIQHKVREKSKSGEEAKQSLKNTASDATEKASETVDQTKEKAQDAVSETFAKGDEFKEKSKEKLTEVKDEANSSKDSLKEKAFKEAETAKDNFSDVSQQVSETATGLKEVGIEAGKAVVRDAGKLAEKIGLKNPK